MNNRRKWIFRAGTLALLIIICVIMFIIGRGHTIYFDNKTAEYDGQTFSPPYKIEVTVDGERVAKLYEKERGMASTMGQNFSMLLDITDEKGGSSYQVQVGLPLPYNMDGIIVNLPALLAGAPSEAYLSEFIPAPDTALEEDEEVIIDEFELPEEDE